MTVDLATLAALDRLLDAALDRPPEERAAWLASLGGEDARHAPLLRRLLAGDGKARATDWLDRPPPFAPQARPAVEGDETSDFEAGDLVGPWRLVEPLGSGGMGSVWLAERADGGLARPVALKLPHFGARPRAIAERFAREREILASLAHPNIARLYDAGVAPGGQPWLAMELVEGAPITDWCDARALTVEARIALFGQVLRAVQYAHANLVVHRDLKPSNILVTGAGEVKLLDFGIAKLVEGDSVGETELTRIAGRALTLPYASPEQVTGAPISTATDVYSLGVVLFQLATGRAPYRPAGTGPGALERAIVEGEPLRASAAATDAAARARSAADARRLARALRGDLDTILDKALAKGPDARYPTVAAFAGDLERHLAGMPIEARGVPAWYRGWRWLARHRVAFGASAAIALATVAGAGVALWQAGEARREAERASAVQAFLVDLFRSNAADQPDPLRARQTTARELLDRGAERLGGALDGQPAAKERLAAVLFELYLDLGLPAEASDAALERLTVARRLYGPRDARLAVAVVDAAYALTQRDPLPKAAVRELLDEARRIVDDDAPAALRGELEYTSSHYAAEVGDADAIDHAKAAVAAFRGDPGGRMLPRALDWLSMLQSRAGDSDGALASIDEAMSLARAAKFAPHRVARLQLRAGELHSSRGDVEAADRALRDAYALSLQLNGPRSPTTLSARRMLFRHLAESSRTDEAARLAEGFLEDVYAAEGGREPSLAQEARRIVAEVEFARGRLAGAERVLADQEAAWGASPPASFERADFLIARANARAVRGRLDDARRDADAAAAMAAQLGFSSRSPLAINAILARGQAEVAAEDADGARTVLSALEPLLERTRAAAGGDTPQDAALVVAVAALRLAAGDAVAAEAEARRALAGLDGPRRRYFEADEAQARVVLARALLAQRRPGDALPEASAAVALLRRLHVPESPWLGEAIALEATCLAAAGRGQEARGRLDEARAIYAAAGPLDAPMARALDRASAAVAGPPRR